MSTLTVPFTIFERKIQQKLNPIYQGMGYTIIRNGDKGKDLYINSKATEEKIRTEVRKDILIEILQDITSANLGWYYTTKAELLNYVMCNSMEPQLIYWIDWPKFKKWFVEDFLSVISPRGQYIISIRGYGVTLNIPVPIISIPDFLYQKQDLSYQTKLL